MGTGTNSGDFVVDVDLRDVSLKLRRSKRHSFVARKAPGFYPMRAISKAVGLEDRSVRRAIESGKVRHFCVDRYTYVSLADFLMWLRDEYFDGARVVFVGVEPHVVEALGLTGVADRLVQ